MPELTVKDIGPVVEFKYEFAEPGLHVLVGEKGSGKSTTLRVIERIVQGESAGAKPTKRDGAKKGEASLAGKTLAISRTTRDEGELDVEGLGDLDLSVLHSPKFEKGEIRDKYRIATLARLSGLSGSIDTFKSLVSADDWNQYIGPKVQLTDDIVDLSARVKRALDAGALDVEKECNAARQQAAVCASQCDGVDTSGECDEATLGERFTGANQRLLQLENRNVQARGSAAAAAAAKEALEAMPVVDLLLVQSEWTDALQYQQNCIAANLVDIKQTQGLLADLRTRVLDAEQALREKEKVAVTLRETLDSTQAQQKQFLDAAIIARDKRVALERAVEAQVIPVDEAAEIAAREAVAAAQQAMVDGRLRRMALTAKENRRVAMERATELESRAKALRLAGQQALEVVSAAVAKLPHCPLKIRVNTDGDTRLVIATDRSDEELFDELSDGERWSVIVPLCLRDNMLLTLPQAAFGELPPSTRLMLHEAAAKAGATLVTAVAKDVPLTAMSYGDFAARFGG